MVKKNLFLFCICLALSITTPANASNIYNFSFDGTDHTLNPLSGTQSANEYYNYSRPAANPLHGYTADDSAYFWLYDETDTNALSLAVVFGDDGSSANG